MKLRLKTNEQENDREKNSKRQSSGITLIALIVTIIVLLILCKALHNINYAKLKVMQSCQQKCFRISILETYNFA